MSLLEQQPDNQNNTYPPLSALYQQKLNINWPDYLNIINQLPANFKIASSLKLLNKADELMNQLQAGVSEGSQIERFLIGGIADNKTISHFKLDPELLGSMTSFAGFKKILKNDASGLQKLLKIIPAKGRIDGWHYMQFTDGYRQLFEANGIKQAPLFPATRLLAMKRPDQFVCIEPATDNSFYQAFGIKALKKNDFSRYWDEIILTIQQTEWFKQDLPMDPSQLAIYRTRVCLLERLLNPPAQIQVSETEFESEADLERETNLGSEHSAKNTHADPQTEATFEQPKSPEQPSNKGIEANFDNPRSNLEQSYSHTDSPSIVSKNGIDIAKNSARIYQTAKQPKKMKIAQRKSDKVNKAAATKLMSQYYFANKEKFAKVDMSKKREQIIQKLCDGESVEEAFAALI